MRDELRKSLWLSLLILGGVLGIDTAGAQQSYCADCHFAHPEAPAQHHLMNWDHSAHGRNNIGCEACHRGDPSTFESFLAHRGILSSYDPASPTNRSNLPRTCGACHIGPLVAFQKSVHYELLRQGDDHAPTCSTCHGSVAANFLSAKRFAKQCKRCHGEGKTAYRDEYPIMGELMLEKVGEVRKQLEQAEHLIHRIKDEERCLRLQEVYRRAEVPLIRAVQSGHSFVFDEMQEQLALAQRRAQKLLEELANPSTKPYSHREND